MRTHLRFLRKFNNPIFRLSIALSTQQIWERTKQQELKLDKNYLLMPRCPYSAVVAAAEISKVVNTCRKGGTANLSRLIINHVVGRSRPNRTPVPVMSLSNIFMFCFRTTRNVNSAIPESTVQEVFILLHLFIDFFCPRGQVFLSVFFYCRIRVGSVRPR